MATTKLTFPVGVVNHDALIDLLGRIPDQELLGGDCPEDMARYPTVTVGPDDLTNIFWKCCGRMLWLTGRARFYPEEIKALHERARRPDGR